LLTILLIAVPLHPKTNLVRKFSKTFMIEHIAVESMIATSPSEGTIQVNDKTMTGETYGATKDRGDYAPVEDDDATFGNLW